MCLFDALGMRLNNQVSLWCVQEQLGQILLIKPLTLTVFELYVYERTFSFYVHTLYIYYIFQSMYYITFL